MFTEVVKIYIDLLVERNEYLERRMKKIDDSYGERDEYDDITYSNVKSSNKVRSMLLTSINEEIEKVDQKYSEGLDNLSKEELEKSIETLRNDQRTLVVRRDQREAYSHYYDLFIENINESIRVRKILNFSSN